jgi:hypothetical protein
LQLGFIIFCRKNWRKSKSHNVGEIDNKATYDYDYAVFELEEPVNTFNDRIEPVCLPDGEDASQEIT